jgi:AraC-like DNA-binding protein
MSTALAPDRPWVAGRPHRALQRVLRGGYLGLAGAGEPHRMVLPATVSVPLVVKLEDSAYRPPQFVMGGNDAVVVPDGVCAPSYLQLRLAPLAAFTVLGVPIRRLHGDAVDLADLLGPAGRRIADQLREAGTWSERFALLDAFLLRRLGEGPRPAREVGRAWHRLVSTDGAAPIGSIAREVGWSHKHLISRFRDQVGVTPKIAASIVRFEAVLRRIELGGSKAGHDVHWGDLAATGGYFDQAHLIRDFRRFTGGTPRQFVALAAGTERDAS